MSIVIQCPMCQDFDPEAACRFCSLIPQAHVDEWKLAVNVAKDAPNTGMVPVKSSTLLVINAALANAIAAQQPAVAQGAGEVVHQFRKKHCSDWYDGHPDHSDGKGPYEVRTLYTQPAAGADVLTPDEIIDMARVFSNVNEYEHGRVVRMTFNRSHLLEFVAAIAASGRQE